MDRKNTLILLRPEIPSAASDEKTSTEESFQNNILRPIIKFQHNLVVAIIKQAIQKHNKDFFNLSKEKQQLKIESIFATDNQLKNDLKGVIIGLLTTEEYKSYYLIKNEINKRIIQMIKERFISTL